MSLFSVLNTGSMMRGSPARNKDDISEHQPKEPCGTEGTNLGTPSSGRAALRRTEPRDATLPCAPPCIDDGRRCGERQRPRRGPVRSTIDRQDIRVRLTWRT
jgi:hypothetical protein